jgi:acetyl-CoA synthase
MSKIIATAAIKGAHKIIERALEKYEEAVKKFGKETEIGFPNTAYYLPIIYAILGYPVKKLGDCEEVLQEAKRLLPELPSEKTWLPYLAPALDAGMATFFAEEIIEAIRYLEAPNFYVKGEDVTETNFWLGAADDVIFRKRGVEFVDGTAPGFAAILGSPKDKENAARIAQELLEKNLYVFMHDQTNGIYMPELLKSAGVQLGWPTRLVPFGTEYTSVVFAIGFACRVAMSFGGIKPGDYLGNLLYNKDRTFAFVITFGPVSDEWYANGAGAINWGFPVISDWEIPEIKPYGVCTYEHVVPRVPHDQIVDRAVEVRGLKVTTIKLDIPVAYAPAFEGERVRKDDLYLECGGGRSAAVELLISANLDEVEDGKIEVIGPEISDVSKLGIKGPPYILPFAIVVKVAGVNMQSDFEAILERQFHHLVNYAQGIMHVGQRNIMWLRFSKQAVEKGFQFKHIGKILYAKLRQEFSAIVDKCEVTIYTIEDKVREVLDMAKRIYAERDARLAGLTDESVDIYYSCTLCQSFAPSHVCVITPERVGACGAYNWLDGKACYQMNPAGPNQPIPKEDAIDLKLGQYSGINKYVQQASRGKIERLSLYSILIDPMTVCGCMECIAALLPSINGIMIVNRDYLGITPTGMKFSTLAGMVGGGQVTPGFMGLAKHYISSKKFLSAEDGLLRVIWMPKMLKEELKEKLIERASELGVPDLIDKIADDTVATAEEEVAEYIKKVGHPVLNLPPVM